MLQQISINYVVIPENLASDILLQYFNDFEINGYPLTTALVNVLVHSNDGWLDKDYSLARIKVNKVS